MRITGLATGLDMDQIIKDSMKPYRIKIDQQSQKKEIIEIKQKLYREVLKDSKEFYNKYLDVGNKDNLLLSGSYSTVKFTSSNENVVTVKGGSDAKAGSYTVTGTTATPAKATVTSNIKAGEKINVNGKEYTLSGENEREIAKNLNEQLKADKVNVTVKYSDFAGTSANDNKSGLVFESTVMGKNSSFTIGGTFSEPIAGKGTNTVGATLDISLEDLNLVEGKNTIKIGDKTIEVEIPKDASDEDKAKLLSEKLKDHKLSVSIKEGNVTFTSTDLENLNTEIKLTVNEISVDKDTATYKEGVQGEKAQVTISEDLLKSDKLMINGIVIDMKNVKDDNKDGIVDLDEKATYLNNVLSSTGITAEVKDGNILFTSKNIGQDQEIKISTYDGKDSTTVTQGTDANIVIKDSKGGVYTHTGNSNTISLDGITFNFVGEIPEEGVTINGKQDVTELKDKIVNFVNDYNKLIENLNTVIKDKPNKDFMPLTEEQKKEMSEDEIKLWNEKVQKGQLSRDSDITRIVNSLKNALTTPVNGVNLTLEKMGIIPVQDYSGTKNGTFTIDEKVLTEALENNAEEVMNFFTKQPESTEGMTEGEKSSSTGLMYRIKDILYKETVTNSSPLMKKAGYEGTSSFTNNELSRSIEKYEKKMKDMEKDFVRREQALYSKYARLEVMMNKYNSQQSQLMSQFGGM